MLAHLGREYSTKPVSIFEGEGQAPEVLKLNPSGRVPIIVEDDGRALAESNALIAYLADGTSYLSSEPMARAKVHQWLSFEQEQVESVIGTLRHWTMTGKLSRRADDVVSGKRSAARRTLDILDGELSARPFIAGDSYTIADISVFAYAGRAEEADLDVSSLASFNGWRLRVEGQPGFLVTTYPYSMDPHSSRELP
jgi:glutathione S-transferase